MFLQIKNVVVLLETLELSRPQGNYQYKNSNCEQSWIDERDLSHDLKENILSISSCSEAEKTLFFVSCLALNLSGVRLPRQIQFVQMFPHLKCALLCSTVHRFLMVTVVEWLIRYYSLCLIFRIRMIIYWLEHVQLYVPPVWSLLSSDVNNKLRQKQWAVPRPSSFNLFGIALFFSTLQMSVSAIVGAFLSLVFWLHQSKVHMQDKTLLLAWQKSKLGSDKSNWLS